MDNASLKGELSVQAKTHTEDIRTITAIFVNGIPEPIIVEGDFLHRVYIAMSGSHKVLYLKEIGLALRSSAINGAMKLINEDV